MAEMVLDGVGAGVTTVTLGDGVEARTEAGDGLVVLVLRVAAGIPLSVDVETPLGAAVGLWNPNVRGRRTLPPDWANTWTSSLVHSTPLLVLHDAGARALFGIADAEVVDEVHLTGGVSEERKCLLLRIEHAPRPEPWTARIAFLAGQPAFAQAVEALASWQRDGAAADPLPLPPAAVEPVYSTWYTYTQDVDEARVTAEAELAAELGCASVFIDDGWQQHAHGRGYAGCGDWIPDSEKFPDLPGLVDRLRRRGMRMVVWIAPLLLGDQSAAHASMGRFAPVHVEGGMRTNILDPRAPEVRRFVVDTCVRVVRDNGLDGLKIDFLNDAMAHQGTASPGDIDDVGVAMRIMLAEVRDGLAAAGLGEAIVEFRQPYVSPAVTAYGNCLRVGDCPADAVMNRQCSLDLRLLVRGAVVHADPLMWSPDGGAAAVAQQMLSTFFAVPQISMPLATLDEVQRRTLAHHLRLWRAWSDVSLFGDLDVHGIELGYTHVSASVGQRSVVAAYAPVVVDVHPGADTLVLNGSASDRLPCRLPVPAQLTVVSPTGETVADRSVEAGLTELEIPAFGTARILT